MNFKVRPFVVTLVICLVLQLIMAGLNGFLFPIGQAASAPPGNVESIGKQGLLLIAKTGLCLTMWAMYIVGGAVYGVWGARQPPFSIGDGALGGALISAAVSLGGSVLGLCLQAISLVLMKTGGDQAASAFLLVLAPVCLINLLYLVLAAGLGAGAGAIATAASAKPASLPPVG